MALLYRMGTGNGSGGDLKPFIVNFTCHSGFIGKTVTMEFQGTPHAGETVDDVSGTVASDGTLTLYPMHDGLWKYYATSDVSGYLEGTIALEKWGNYPVELKDIPNGATVTPIDDVQTWLHCANIWDKPTITSVTDIDEVTYNILFSSDNANDYLFRTDNTTIISDIVSCESAYTVLSSATFDTLVDRMLTNDVWFNAIVSSESSFGTILKGLLPTFPMQNITSHEGYTISSSLAGYGGTRYATQAFQGATSAGFASDVNSKGYIKCSFPVGLKAYLCTCMSQIENGNSPTVDFYFYDESTAYYRQTQGGTIGAVAIKLDTTRLVNMIKINVVNNSQIYNYNQKGAETRSIAWSGTVPNINTNKFDLWGR